MTPLDASCTPFGFLSGDYIPLSNGNDAWARYEHAEL